MAPAPAPRLWLELLLLATLAVLWGVSYTLTKVAVTEIPPLTVAAARVSIAAVFLLAILAWRGEALPRGAKIWRQLSAQSVFNSIAPWVLIAWGQRFVDSGLAAVLNSTAPLFVYLYATTIIGIERPGLLKTAGVVIGFLGVMVLVGLEALQGLGTAVWAQGAMLLAAIFYAAAAINGRRFSDLPPASTAAAIMIWATICLLPLSLILDRPWLLSPSPAAIGSVAALGVGSTGLALLIYFRLVRTLGSLGVASQSYLRSGIGVLLGVIFLGEIITPAIGLGIGLAIAGVALMNWPLRRRN